MTERNTLHIFRQARSPSYRMAALGIADCMRWVIVKRNETIFDQDTRLFVPFEKDYPSENCTMGVVDSWIAGMIHTYTAPESTEIDYDLGLVP